MVVYAAEAPDPHEAARARRAFVTWLGEAGIDVTTADGVLLVVSELVTNSIRHARTAFTLTAEVVDDGVRVEVFDRDTRLPVQQGADAGATGGRGINIVASLAEQWGVQTDERDGVEGKAVWAVVPVGPPQGG